MTCDIIEKNDELIQLYDDVIRTAPALTQDVADWLETLWQWGWVLLPSRVGDKHPPIPWKEYQDRRQTIQEMQQWFHVGGTYYPNYCVITGYLSGIVVIDCDSAEARAFTNANCPPPVMWVERGDHVHYYYRHPGNCRIGNKAGYRKVKGLDVRGDGGLVVGPGSLHHVDQGGTEHRYEPKGDWSLAALLQSAPFDPAWFGIEEKRTVITVPAFDAPACVLETTASWYLKYGATVEPGRRNASLFGAACNYKAVGESIDKATEVLVPIAMASGLDHAECEAAIASAYSQPRTASVRTDDDNPSILVGKHQTIDEATGKVRKFWQSPQEIAEDAAKTGRAKPVFKGLIHKGLLTSIIAGPKTGKTELLFNVIALSQVAGEIGEPVNYLGSQVYPAKWAMVTEEPAALTEAHQIDHDLWSDDTLVIHSANVPGGLKTMDYPKQLAYMRNVMVPQMHAEHVDVVVFDTLAGVLNIGDTNRGNVIADSFQEVKRIFADFGMVFLMHTRKEQFDNKGKPIGSDREIMSGHQQITAQSDIFSVLRRSDDSETGTKRTFRSWGRLAVPPPMLLDFDTMTKTYAFVKYLSDTDAAEVKARESAKNKIYPMVTDDWTMGKEIVGNAVETIDVHRVTAYRALAALAADGYILSRVVKGKKGNPTEYRRNPDKVPPIDLDDIGSVLCHDLETEDLTSDNELFNDFVGAL